MELSKKQKQWLKQQSHHLNPVILIGQNGITEAVLNELASSLDHHELLKIRINNGDREERKKMIAQIVDTTGALLVSSIGATATLYKANADKPQLELPRI